MRKQINPDFEKIIPKCLRELEIKFADYGNAWLDLRSNYWQQRIKNEIEEYEKSMGTKSAQRKLLNIINMCAMAWENLETGRMDLG